MKCAVGKWTIYLQKIVYIFCFIYSTLFTVITTIILLCWVLLTVCTSIIVKCVSLSWERITCHCRLDVSGSVQLWWYVIVAVLLNNNSLLSDWYQYSFLLTVCVNNVALVHCCVWSYLQLINELNNQSTLFISSIKNYNVKLDIDLLVATFNTWMLQVNVKLYFLVLMLLINSVLWLFYCLIPYLVLYYIIIIFFVYFSYI